MAFHRFLRFIAASILLVGCSIVAAEEKKTALLTEKEIADGWILLFDGESTFGWTGKAEVKNGKLMIPKGETVKYSIGHTPLSTLRDGMVGVTEVIGPGSWSLTAKEENAYIEKFQFRATDMKPIFNGKDLTGWKVFKDEKRSKSTWEVTPAGELSLKNGPGDLQTEKQYDNFLLQLECKVNGTALNSGVFFRCMPDQYQNGYEMQIQNAFKDNDRTKPTDFGTGAIYRRIPARKVVANDKEWFTMTLLAHGPHIATWVNGYPVVSWKDERPADENPRKGLRTAKGHLSIQGHDPTTDLLFRNIRIVELK